MLTITERSGPALNAQVLTAKRCYFPEADYLIGSPLILREGCIWEGDGPLATRFLATGTNAVVQTDGAGTANRTMYCRLKDIGAIGSASQASSDRLLDLRGLSYGTLENVHVNGQNSNARLIDITKGNGGISFNGYNDLRNVYAIYGGYGLIAEVNQLTIQGGSYNSNSIWGIYLSNSADVSFIGPEVSGNAEGETALYTGSYPTGYYDRGGIFCTNVQGIFGRAVWFEGNASRFNSAYEMAPNDVECTSDCSKIDFGCSRWPLVNFNGEDGKGHGLGLDYGQDYGYGNLVQSLLTTDLATWSGNIGTTIADPASNLPTGIYGVRATKNAGIYSSYYTNLLTTNECAQNAGRVVVAKFWVNPITVPADGICRVGISKDGLGTLSHGTFVSAETIVGEPRWYTLQYPIVGTEEDGLQMCVQYGGAGAAAVEIGDVRVTLNELVRH